MMRRIGQHKPTVFGSCDFLSAFHQAPMGIETQVFTAFICFMGMFQFTRLPFGPKRAPSYFQEAMASVVLAGLIYHICEIHIDDCNIFGSSNEEFVSRGRQIFLRFRKHNYYNYLCVRSTRARSALKIQNPGVPSTVESKIIHYMEEIVPFSNIIISITNRSQAERLHSVSELFVIYLAVCSFFEIMQSIVRAEIPVFRKVLDFLEARAFESSSSSPTGVMYLTISIIREDHFTFNFAEWDDFMLLLMPNTRRHLGTSC